MDNLTQIEAVIRKVFKDDSLIIDAQTSADDIDGWDSLTHLQIITEIEKHFSVKFTLSELLDVNTVGDIDRIIQQKFA